MKVALCCIGRLENKYIKEYVEYYKGLGISKIFLYDNNYDGEEHFEDVIGNYINDGFVDVIDYRGKSVCQLEAYQECYNKHNKEYDWICFFDIDEYLTFKDDKMNINDFLSDDKFNDFDMIHVNWKIYYDNDLVYYEDKPLRDRFKEPMPLDFRYGYNFPENNHIKSIVRGGLKGVKWSNTPHTPTRIKTCCNVIGEECKPDSPFSQYNLDVAWLNHYQTKTIQEWIDVKAKRGFPDGNRDFFLRHDVIKSFFKRNRMTEEKQKYIDSLNLPKELIILSMTTIPKRKDRLADNLPAILGQSYKFDKLVINIDDNLSDEDYEWYESLKEKDERIEINKAEAKWRSCNKLLPTLKKYPNDVIITIDDDIYYPVDTIKLLVECYEKNSDCIITHEINPIYINDDKYIGYNNAFDVMLMQKEWGKYFSNCCLFPPHTFDGTDLYDYDKMMECTNGTHDELWFWTQSTINGVQCIGLNYVRSFSSEMLKQYDEGEYQLTTFNNTQEKIKGYMDKINEMYGERLVNNIMKKNTEFVVTKDNIYAFFFLWKYIKKLYKYNYTIRAKGLTRNWQNRLIAVIKGNEEPRL